MDINEITKAMTADIYQAFKTAVELRKWPNGERLTPEQTATCLQAIIAWETQHVPVEERVGYIPPKKSPAPTTAIFTPTKHRLNGNNCLGTVMSSVGVTTYLKDYQALNIPSSPPNYSLPSLMTTRQ